MLQVPKIYNDKGVEVTLTEQEKAVAQGLGRQVYNSPFKRGHFNNALGYEIAITTLTTIMKKISQQKFFEIPPADYIPVRVGEGAWSSNLVTYRSFDVADDFETGIINVGSQNSRQAVADTGVDSLTIQVINWAKTVQWNIFDLEMAAKSGNWDVVTAKEKARKRNWDLGVQRVAFLGARGLNSSTGPTLGLLNQAGITTNTTTITTAISALTTAQLKTFCATVIEDYRANVQRTSWPTHFIIPESDYNGLASQSSPDFPIKSVLAVLQETFALITRNAAFKILPLAYGDPAYHADVTAIAGKYIYILLNYDEESLRMDVPLDYTNTLANSLDNFNFQNVGYGQFTGVLTLRPLEMLYFTR